MKQAKQIVSQVTYRLFGEGGCGDGGCVFGHPGGMQTNGGCQCLKDDTVMLRRHLMRLSQVARTLATMVEEEK